MLVTASAFGQQPAPQMPDAWKKRTLRVPPGYEALQPSDVVIGFAWKRGPDGFSKTGAKDMVGILEYSAKGMGPGSSPEEAERAMSGVLMSSHVPRALVLRGSDLLGKVTVGWTAFVRVAHFMPPQAGGHPTQGAGFVYGAASLNEALEEAAARAIAGFKSAGGGRFETVMVEAGVAAQPDYDLYKRNGTFGNICPLPFTVRARFPEFAATGPLVGYQPQFPQEAKELVRWLLAPEQKGRMYGQRHREWFGLSDVTNLLKPGMAPPVFLVDGQDASSRSDASLSSGDQQPGNAGLQDAAYRPDSSLSAAERQQRDETAQLALEMYERSGKVPAARDSAVKLLLEAAKLGHLEAQYVYGANQFNRGPTRDDRMNGLRWLSAAARQGHVAAKYALIEGLEEFDPARALREMEALANSGALRVFINLAWVYREGRLGVQRNQAKAFEYLERGVSFAGATGDSEPYRNWLMDELAAACFTGDGTTQNRARAAQLLRGSGMEGQSQASPGDIFRAYFYATGEHGFPRDPKNAAKLLDNVLDEWRYYREWRPAIRVTVNAALASSSAAADPKR